MTSHDALVAWAQVMAGLALLAIGLLVIALVRAHLDWVQERRESRARLAAMPKPTPAELTVFRGRLLAAIPAQGKGGESDAR